MPESIRICHCFTDICPLTPFFTFLCSREYRFRKELMNAKAKERNRRLLQLFFSTLYLSAFTFGGGYVIISLLKQKFVDQLHWIDEEEMLDLIAIAQSSPGPIAVNGAIVIGYKLCGFPGILVSVLGAIIPPFVILTAVSMAYDAFRQNFVIQSMLSGMRAGISAVIISVVWDMGAGIVKEKDPLRLAIMLLAFLANYVLKIPVIVIILCAAGAGFLSSLLHAGRKENV